VASSQAPTTRTPKGEHTRQTIQRAALALFSKRGYRDTTLRDIARRARTSVGLTYRYFPSKEAIVLAVYEDLAQAVEAKAVELPSGTLGARFEAILEMKLSMLAPHREAFGALVGPALDPASEVSVAGHKSTSVRARMLRVFENVVEGATDAPSTVPRDDLVAALYVIHLVVLLAWTHDRHKGAPRVRELLADIHSALDASGPLFALPPVREGLKRITAFVRAMLF
jgi:AcrR family transcriptional regulator